jgi:hypothetical protein
LLLRTILPFFGGLEISPEVPSGTSSWGYINKYVVLVTNQQRSHCNNHANYNHAFYCKVTK